MSSENQTQITDAAPAVDAPTTSEPPVVNISDELDGLIKETVAEQGRLKKRLETFRNLKKADRRRAREGLKRKNKKHPYGEQSVPRKASGFATPKYISPELCEFLGIPVGTQRPRTEIGPILTNYVKEHKLTGREGFLRKDGELNRQYITPDEKLIKLIGNPDALNFFSLQRELNKHFKDPQLTAAA